MDKNSNCSANICHHYNYGRRTTLLISGILAASVWFVCLFTKHIVVLFIARLLQGAYLATVDVVSPVYIAEICGAKRRGTFGGFFNVFWNLGTLYAFINSDYLPFDEYTITLMLLPVLFCSTFVFMPESPYYYFMKNEPDKAKSSLQWVRCGEDIEVEYKEIEEAVREDMKNAGSWKDLIATKEDRRALYIVLIVLTTRYLIGLTVVVAYAENIFAKAGQQMFTPNQQSIGLALLFTVSSAAASFFSDIVGRRKLLIYSLIGTAISNAIIAVYFGLLELTSLQVTPYVWIMYAGTLGYCIFTTVGPAMLVPTMRAEFFPSHTRSKGVAMTNLIALIFLLVQEITFPIIAAEIGIYFNFIIFGTVATIGCIFVTIYVPESAGKTLAEVNQTVKDIVLH
ncbi:probable metabolite transport protein CsbC isoform X2 [Rhodnius prolixus]|uniref:probable metabolite transport protein CsbC isoform X2 n=1 Tax=Rhodnius prolixus TaxID=13249 RepID=UPI003D18DE5C